MLSYLKKSLVVSELEIRKMIHDPTELITRAVQPALWILIFGEVFEKIHPLSGNLKYIDFLTPGILAQSVLFVSIFYGIAIIWERDLGLTHKFLATPTPRSALVLGKALSSGFRSLPIVLIIYCIAILLGVQLRSDPLSIVLVIIMVLLGSVFFSTFSLVIACLVKTRERFMGFGQLLTMPLFFASNAIYPIGIMPGWLKVISKMNPLTYVIDALRNLMLVHAPATSLAKDFGIVLLMSMIIVAIGGILYKKVIT